MHISNKNIRATALHEFWGEEYSESLYLWQGAKHNGTLAEIEKDSTPTLQDVFSTQEEIQKGHEFCKSFYYRMLTELSGRLNKVHNLELPVSFWQAVFGIWLYRHISVVYEKYAYLSSLDIDATDIKLLSKDNFYIPQNHVDYIFCFAGDFGVQQLVSQYYYSFKTNNFKVVHGEFKYDEPSSNSYGIASRIKRKLFMLKADPQIALLGVCFGENTRSILEEKSHGRLSSIILPVTKKNVLEVDFDKRDYIASGVVESSFESYFIQSLYHCLPKDFLENFLEYYNVFQKDIKSRKLTHIVSEDWITNIPNAIYIALAKENKTTFICQEHAVCRCYYENGTQFIDFDVADIYLSTGWRKNNKNFTQGGFACRDIIPYKHDQTKKTILYISGTRFIYWDVFNEYGATNSTFIRELRMVADLIDLISPALKATLLFRPRPAKFLWDVERLLELDKHSVKIDRGDFTESICQSRIVIIDHLSTGLAEILLMKVPFILLYDVRFLAPPSELRKIFNDLIGCGVVHFSAKSAVSHLSFIYDDVEGWWQSEAVRGSVNQLTDFSLAPANRTTNFLLSLLSKDCNSRPTLVKHFWASAEVCARHVYRLMKKIRSLILSRTK